MTDYEKEKIKELATTGVEGVKEFLGSLRY